MLKYETEAFLVQGCWMNTDVTLEFRRPIMN